MNGCLRVIVVLIFLLVPYIAFSQENNPVKYEFAGKIVDNEGNTVPYATVYIEEAKSGVATNYEGAFSMKLEAGTYNIRVQHVNYETIFRTLQLDGNKLFQIKMTPKSILLSEVEVRPDREDPAYAVMRKAIAKAPYYRRLFESYKAESYNKGTLRVDKLPKIMSRAIKKADSDLDIKVGDVFTQERISEIVYENDSARQTIISVKSSFPDQIGLNDAFFDAFALFNIYGQTPGLVSPLSRESFATYKFALESATHNEYGKKVYHIRLTPKQKNNPLAFTGHIDIVDSTWHVHYFDISARQDLSVAKVEYNIKENFSELEKDVWAPTTLFLKMNASALKMEATIDLSAAIKYKEYQLSRVLKPVEPNGLTTPMLPDNEIVVSDKSKKLEEKIVEISQKEEMSNRDALKVVSLIEAKDKEDRKNNPAPREKETTLEIKSRSVVTIDSLAHMRTDAYWDEMRSVPLSEAEAQGYQEKQVSDSIKKAKGTMPRLSRNQPDGLKPLYYGVDLFASSISFNPVDALKIKVNGYLNKRFKDTTMWHNSLTLGYSFGQKHLLFAASSRYDYYPEKRATIGISGGQEAFDFNISSGVQPIVNTISTLFFKENYLKMYQRAHLRLFHDIELFNGFDTKVSLGYEWRKQLHNETDYSFFYKESKEYEENVPDNPYVASDPSCLNDGRAALISVELRYTPQRYYTYSNRRKQFLRSKYPTLSLIWKKGIPDLFGSTVNFDYLQIGISQKIRMGVLKSIDYEATGGWFVNRQSMHFSDFKHFRTCHFPLMFDNIYKAYHTMDVYRASSNEWMVSGFFKYETPYLVLKYIPGLNRTLMTESLYLSYLKTPFVKDYIELGYSLDNIWLVGNIGVFVGFENFRYAQWSLKVSINLSSF